jgi:hypothetical protein
VINGLITPQGKNGYPRKAALKKIKNVQSVEPLTQTMPLQSKVQLIVG